MSKLVVFAAVGLGPSSAICSWCEGCWAFWMQPVCLGGEGKEAASCMVFRRGCAPLLQGKTVVRLWGRGGFFQECSWLSSTASPFSFGPKAWGLMTENIKIHGQHAPLSYL